MNKITIIGAGSVGSTIAYTIAAYGLASEVCMIDINTAKAEGEALDIYQGTPFCNPCNIYSGSYADAAGSKIVVLTSGVARKPGQSRLDLAQINVNITRSIIPEITKHAPDATYLIVSNPVDILTYTFFKYSNIPAHKIVGSGTILDTARLRSTIADLYKVDPATVHAYILGEHGDSSFASWSQANIANVPLLDYSKAVGSDIVIDTAETEEYVRKSGGIVIKNKGATFYAVSLSVCHLIKCLLGGTDTPLAVSTMMNGEYGIEDVCLSVPCLVGKNSVNGKIMMNLPEDEIAKLQNSANALKEVINAINWD